jgi:hypothetical protein
MTAKEKLRQAVEELSELEAEAALAYISQRREPDAMLEAFDNAPIDDEPFTEEDERALEEAHAARRRGDTLPLDDIRGEVA